MEGTVEEDGSDVKRRSSGSTPAKSRNVVRRTRRCSVACGGGSAEKKRNMSGKQRRIDHEKRKNQRKSSRFGMREMKIDPLNIMGISQKEECNSPKVDSPQVGDRGSNFDPDNLRPVDVTDPLKLNNLDDTVLAVKISSHKKKRKRRRRRTYSENDKDMKAFIESMGPDGETEPSDIEGQSPKKLKSSQTEDGKEQEAVECKVDVKVFEVDAKADENGERRIESDKQKPGNFSIKAKSDLTFESKPEDSMNQSKKVNKTESQEDGSKRYNLKFREKDRKFQYGNYNRYYGYRNPNLSEDDRIEYLKREWFEGKDCLDIGCNVGHLTLYIARHFNPKFLTGSDIDNSLIKSARRNTQHYICVGDPQAPKQSEFPISFPICLGPLAAPILPENGKSFGFPYNISFKTENYVDFEWGKIEIEPEYDFIMCLSVTKWIQLNWGDEGVKKLFKRIFLSLLPGGKLLLEPQPWKSYKKKKNLTLTTRSNFDNIQFRPDKYIQYLLSEEVGFARSEKLGIPKHKAQGFQRPIYLLTKSGIPQSEAKDLERRQNFEVDGKEH